MISINYVVGANKVYHFNIKKRLVFPVFFAPDFFLYRCPRTDFAIFRPRLETHSSTLCWPFATQARLRACLISNANDCRVWGFPKHVPKQHMGYEESRSAGLWINLDHLGFLNMRWHHTAYGRVSDHQNTATTAGIEPAASRSVAERQSHWATAVISNLLYSQNMDCL